MSQNILIDGKPLAVLRVVDLRDELKKRGIRASGTKSHLQELLISAIQAEQKTVVQPLQFAGHPQADKDVIDLSKDSTFNASENNSALRHFESEQKVASISINEESKTIKLSIRNSPRKSELPCEENNESNTSESESNDTSDSVEIFEEKNQLQNNGSHDKNEVDDQPEKSVNIHTTCFTNNEKQDVQNFKPDESVVKPQVFPNIEPDSHSDESNDDNEVDLESKLEVQKENSEEEVAIPKNNESLVSDPDNVHLQSKPSLNDMTQVEQECLEQEPKSNKLSIRGRLLSHSKSINEDDASNKPIQKKRRWGGSLQQAGDASVLKKGISSDELKQMINETEPVIENDNLTKVSKDSANKEEELIEPATELTNNEPEEKEPIKKVDMSFKCSDNATSSNSSALKVVSKLNEQLEAKREPENIETRAVSPPKNPVSAVLFISGLVRPYTLPQLKKLLNVHGPIDEEKFWIDKIKSKCYAVYATSEEASETRESLHNLKWPQSSPKNLSVEFATLEDVDRCLHPENYESLPPKANPPENDNKRQENRKQATVEIGKGKYDIIQNEPVPDNKASAKSGTHREASPRNVREWDRSKVSRHARKENEEDSRKRRHSPMTQSGKEKNEFKSPDKRRKADTTPAKEPAAASAERQSESPQRLLEDLFRKTKAFPYLYWLPLTEEQVAEKEKQRIVLEKERQERISRRDLEPKSSPSPNRPAPLQPMHHNFPRDRPKFGNPNFRRRSPPPASPRRRRSGSASPRRFSRYSRSRSPDRRRFSPRRRR